MSHRDILKIVTTLVFSERRLRSRVEFFEADIYDAEFLGASFGTIRYSPKIFLEVIQDLGSFLESSFWPVTRKRLIFEIWFRF